MLIINKTPVAQLEEQLRPKRLINSFNLCMEVDKSEYQRILRIAKN